MPGRLAIFDDKQFKEEAFSLIRNDMIQELTKRYNIPPTGAIPALLNNGNYLYTHFGYLPSWAKDKSSININARSESIFEKKTFRDSFRFRRCIIPVNGFYEWKIDGKEKKPYFVKDSKKNFLALAGIWDEYFDKDINTNIVTVALITCDANEKLGKIHPRMPIILEEKNFSSWLYNDNLQDINSLFRIYPSESLSLEKVSTIVNKVKFDNSTCIKPLKEEELGQLSFF